jgi:hypothetical protein
MTEFLTRTRIDRLDAERARLLDEQGYLLLRGAIPAAWIGPLRDVFEAGVLPSKMWPGAPVGLIGGIPCWTSMRQCNRSAAADHAGGYPPYPATSLRPGAGRGP